MPPFRVLERAQLRRLVLSHLSNDGRRNRQRTERGLLACAYGATEKWWAVAGMLAVVRRPVMRELGTLQAAQGAGGTEERHPASAVRPQSVPAD
jgi:hypothetical protein